jgi:exoribonuclease-2
MSPSTTSGREELREIARRAMVERGLLPDFSPAALAEASAVGGGAVETGPAIRDLRDRPWLSIDNDDSRDLDQLTLAEPLAGGAVRVLVAIADVDATVRADGAIDAHARTNTTSVYTAAQIFPMLPERLSTDLTSLGERDERLAVVVEMMVDADGSVARSDVYRALVRNQAKLAYDSVAAWLEGTAEAPAAASRPDVLAQLRLQDRLAQAMKALRHQRGALTLGTTETRAVFEGELLTDLLPDEKNRAKELIEDFMIAANVATAQCLERRGFPSLRRVLRAPERWERIVELASGLGERLPAQASAPALQTFLTRRLQADPLRFPDLSLSVVKLLGSGEYAVESPGGNPDGHFGLAVKDYSHSTAPNRRFPDLATQRLLKAAIAGLPCPYTMAQLTELALHCTAQEDNASKVERQVSKSAAALLLAPRLGERFSGIVTGASPKGTWVRVLRPPVEGRIMRGEHGLDVGDRVSVELVHTDVERGFIDFARANGR